jgi:hypothetical protein
MRTVPGARGSLTETRVRLPENDGHGVRALTRGAKETPEGFSSQASYPARYGGVMRDGSGDQPPPSPASVGPPASGAPASSIDPLHAGWSEPAVILAALAAKVAASQ